VTTPLNELLLLLLLHTSHDNDAMYRRRRALNVLTQSRLPSVTARREVRDDVVRRKGKR